MIFEQRRVRPVEQLVLQGTSFCNIDCTYCDLSQESRRTKSQMPIALVLKLIRELIEENLLADELVVVWHSGEPLTLPPEYYSNAIEKILELRTRLAPQVSVTFDFQTNAILIDEAWCDFFDKYASVLRLGVSCDGPQALHDAFRIDRKGKSTFNKVLNGMEMLNRRGIRYNVIAVVTRKTFDHFEAFLGFFYERRDSLTDFHINMLASPISDHRDLIYGYDDQSDYYLIYRKLFDWWERVCRESDDFPFRNLTQTLERLSTYGQPDAPSFIRETSAPLRSLNVDTLGNLTTFYAGLDIATDANRYGDGNGLALGNISHTPLVDMLRSSKFLTMVNDFDQSHARCEKYCDYFAVCPGGFELIQWQDKSDTGTPETLECLIHVKVLTDAALDFINSMGSDVEKGRSEFDGLPSTADSVE